MLNNSFKTRTTLDVAGKEYEIFSLKRLEAHYEISRLPYCEHLQAHAKGGR